MKASDRTASGSNGFMTLKVVIPPKAEKAPKMSDGEQAHMLGVLFATTASESSSEPKIPRNAPSPCGSGKKYKLCCGRGKA